MYQTAASFLNSFLVNPNCTKYFSLQVIVNFALDQNPTIVKKTV